MFDYAPAVRYLLLAGMVFLSVTLFFCLFFIISKGRKITDRIVATNMIGVKTILLIVIIAAWLGKEYLIDVAFVYALLSFLATVVFTQLLVRFRAKKTEARGRHDADESEEYGVM